MPNDDLIARLESYKRGELGINDLLHDIARLPFETHDIGRIDHLRAHRTGVPEVILAEGKKPSDVAAIFADYHQRRRAIFASRCTEEICEVLSASGHYHHYDEARIWSTVDVENQKNEQFQPFSVVVVSAGTLDRPVAEEAAVSAELFGLHVRRVYDVGVAGLNRLLPELPMLEEGDVVIVAAGMDGALPSVLGGLVDSPLVAVPTSVGYGSAFRGISSLLAMLNACSPGVVVCNIDNGFGAAAHALKIVRRLAAASNRT